MPANSPRPRPQGELPVWLREPMPAQRGWAPSRRALAGATKIATWGAFALAVLLAVLIWLPPATPPTKSFAFAAAALGGCVVFRAMIESDSAVAIFLGIGCMVPTSIALLAWTLATPFALLLGLLGSEALSVGLALVAGGALGWSGAQWSVATLAHMLGGFDEDESG